MVPSLEERLEIPEEETMGISAAGMQTRLGIPSETQQASDSDVGTDSASEAESYYSYNVDLEENPGKYV